MALVFGRKDKMRSMLGSFCLLFFIAAIVYTASAKGQTPNGSVHGTVADPTGELRHRENQQINR
jgi:hypothetical protein